MHYAKLENSPRLQRTLEVLADKEKHSTLDLIQQTGSCAIASIVSELRRNGIGVECKRSGDKWEYWLA